MKNLSIVYDSFIDIWLNGSYKRVYITTSEYIGSEISVDLLNPKGVVKYDYSLLNLTGRILDMRTTT